jgi:cell division protein FtsL
MAATDILLQQKFEKEEQSSWSLNFSSLIICTVLLLAVALIYVWSHVNMTKLEYQLAEEVSRREYLLEEQKRLKGEVAALKAPQRIELIARSRLDMCYPERDQVVMIKP